MTRSLDIANLRALYESGGTTPEDVVADVYARIDAAGERPVWISLFSKGAAIERARSAPRGPLWGIPFAVKDNIDVAGLPTTCACPAFAYTPETSAAVVARLEAAGAIVIGKTNLDQFATGLVGTRSPYGIPASVFNADYISGGSSSGSAVAVAGGLISFALGTDTAGSGRVPAAFNNIVGLKPTKGLLSTRGVVPACRTQDTVSIFALTASDAVRVMEIASAFDVEDPYSRRSTTPFRAMDIPRPLRVGVPATGLEFFGDTAARTLFDDAVARLKQLGAKTVDVDITPFRDAAGLLYAGPWVAERLAAIRKLAESAPDEIHEVVRSIILGGTNIRAVDAFESFYRLADLTRQAEVQWGAMDALLLPTAPTTYTIRDVLADPVRLNSNLGIYTNFVNLMDLSALAVPAGFRPNGLPFGVTLIARAFDDGMLATLGDALHRTLGSVRLGATDTTIDACPAVTLSKPAERRIEVAVVGAHLSGQPLNWQLSERAARLEKTTRTAPGYRLFALPGTTPPKPGLVFDGTGSGAIEVEVWSMTESAFGSFVGLVPAPLAIGTLTLADGSSVKGFVCEAHAVRDAEDITRHGGWRGWLAVRAT